MRSVKNPARSRPLSRNVRRLMKMARESPMNPEVEKIERELRKILPPEHSSDFCHCIVLHGRAVCDARKPLCETCCLRHLCQHFSG